MPAIMTIHVETNMVEGALFDASLDGEQRIVMRPDSHATNVAATLGDERAYFARLLRFINEFVDRAHLQDELVAVSIIHPGLVDPTRGIVLDAGRFQLFNLEVAQVVRQAIGVDTFVFHDGPCLALGEVKYGLDYNKLGNSTSDGSSTSQTQTDITEASHTISNQIDGLPQNFVYVIVGEGVGSAIFLNGKHYAGASFSAGDLGHIMVEQNGPMCPACYRPGCLETFTSRHWVSLDILNRYQRVQGKCEQDTPFNRSLAFFRDPGEISVDQIARAARDHNEFVEPAIARAAERLGFGVALMIDYLNPDLVIFGGEMMDRIESYYELTLREARAKCLPAAWERTTCRRASIGRSAEHWGAAELALERLVG